MQHLGRALTLLLHVRLRLCACVCGRRHFRQTSYYAAGYLPPLQACTLSDSTQCRYLYSELDTHAERIIKVTSPASCGSPIHRLYALRALININARVNSWLDYKLADCNYVV